MIADRSSLGKRPSSAWIKARSSHPSASPRSRSGVAASVAASPVSRPSRRLVWALARSATRRATPCSQGLNWSRSRIDRALRTRTRKVAWKASSTSVWFARIDRQTAATIGPWRRRIASNARSSASLRNRSRSCRSESPARLAPSNRQQIPDRTAPIDSTFMEPGPRTTTHRLEPVTLVVLGPPRLDSKKSPPRSDRNEPNSTSPRRPVGLGPDRAIPDDVVR